ncbi:NAD-dependent epimerase/dehydratase family protein [Sinorhizobium meliloti]
MAEFEVRGYDRRRCASEDVCDPAALDRAMQGVTGVVHLAAVSRVVWAENDPDLCQRTNVMSVQSLVQSCLAKSMKPRIISASSREVYDQAHSFPCMRIRRCGR